MDKFLSLTKVFLKNSKHSLAGEGKNKLLKNIFLYCVLAVTIIPLMAVFAGLTVLAYNFLHQMNQEGIILSAAMSVSSSIIFAFGIFLVISVFYFSSDIEGLLVLPIKPSVVLMSKFTVVLVYEYFTEALIVAPVILTFGVKSGAGLLYYIYSLIIFLTLPILPLIIGALLSIIIMRFGGFAKNKDRFRMIAQAMVLVFAVAINVSVQKIGKGFSNGEEVANILSQGNNSMVGSFSKLFISIKYAAEGLLYNNSLHGLINMLIYIAITAASLLIFMLLANKFYLKGVVGITQSQAKRKVLSSTEMNKQSVLKSKMVAYTKKEFNLLFRTPIYFMNCVVMTFLWPVFFLIPLATQPDLMGKFLNSYKYMPIVAASGKGLGLIIGIAFSITVMITMSSPIAITAVSREGKNVFVNKYLPMDYKQQLLSKVFTAFVLNLFSMVLFGTFIAIVTRPPLFLIVSVLITTATGTLFSVLLGIIIDLNYPKLDWDNEQRVIKQNLNVIVVMVLGALIAGIVFVINMVFDVVFASFFPILITVFSILNFLLYRYVTTAGVKLFRNID